MGWGLLLKKPQRRESLSTGLMSLTKVFTLTVMAVNGAWASTARAADISGCSADAAVNNFESIVRASEASTRMAELMKDQCGPKNPLSCALVVQAKNQAAQFASLAKQSASSAREFSQSTSAMLGDNKLLGRIAAIEQDLKDKGLQISDSGNFTMGVQTFSMAATASSEEAVKAGLTIADYQAMESARADAQSELIKEMPMVKNGYVCGAPKSIGRTSHSAASSVASQSAASASASATVERLPAAALALRQPRNLAGLSLLLETDRIGIRQDNLFDMMSRRYKTLESSGAFISDGK